MERPDDERLAWLWETTTRYRESLLGTEAEEYLTAREIPASLIARAGLGLVTEPSTEHSKFEGFLSIPYLRRTPRGKFMVPSLRFRCIQDHDHVGHGKYMTSPGDRPRLYNTLALTSDSDVICICEGELDALAAEAAGVPAVGLPGAESWKDHWRLPFAGYKRVVLLPDGDEAGDRWARKVAGSLGNALVLPCPPGKDVNELLLELGPDQLHERITQ